MTHGTCPWLCSRGRRSFTRNWIQSSASVNAALFNYTHRRAKSAGSWDRPFGIRDEVQFSRQYSIYCSLRISKSEVAGKYNELCSGEKKNSCYANGLREFLKRCKGRMSAWKSCCMYLFSNQVYSKQTVTWQIVMHIIWAFSDVLIPLQRH